MNLNNLTHARVILNLNSAIYHLNSLKFTRSVDGKVTVWNEHIIKVHNVEFLSWKYVASKLSGNFLNFLSRIFVLRIQRVSTIEIIGLKRTEIRLSKFKYRTKPKIFTNLITSISQSLYITYFHLQREGDIGFYIKWEPWFHSPHAFVQCIKDQFIVAKP